MSRCLFCHRRFPEPCAELPDALPPGRRFALDPERARLWTICGACRRWSLTPLEERGEALDALERLARDRGDLLYRTENVALVQVGPLRLLRVGRATLAEQAWWRYGATLRRRRQRTAGPGARVSAATIGAAALLARRIGVTEHGPRLVWDDAPLTELLRWRLFGWAAWRGARRCASCGSVLRALPFDLTWWLYPRVEAPGSLTVGIPCPRCDPWSPEKVYRVDGDEAVGLLRRALAWQHVRGAQDDRIAAAAGAIAAAGSPGGYLERAAGTGVSLWSLGPLRALALEIALNEEAEHAGLAREVTLLEATWRREEELARIVDDELTPMPALSDSIRSCDGPGHIAPPDGSPPPPATPGEYRSCAAGLSPRRPAHENDGSPHSRTRAG
ncbi:MAG TPA: hypothetical protein VMK65_12805 [Longimicrobiales bacterium]|nr:hypothetical protein [Longimicrobiales bacterium]